MRYTCCTMCITGAAHWKLPGREKKGNPVTCSGWKTMSAAGLQESLRLIRMHSTTPLAIGEVCSTVYDFTILVTEQLIDYIRMQLVHGAGITHLLKAATFVSFYHIRTGIHGATDLSPVNMAAALHFSLAINNYGIQEYMVHEDLVNEVFRINYHFEKGYLYIDDTRGIGVDIEEEKAGEYPYSMTSLPVSRKEDGTMFYW